MILITDLWSLIYRMIKRNQKDFSNMILGWLKRRFPRHGKKRMEWEWTATTTQTTSVPTFAQMQTTYLSVEEK